MLDYYEVIYPIRSGPHRIPSLLAYTIQSVSHCANCFRLFDSRSELIIEATKSRKSRLS